MEYYFFFKLKIFKSGKKVRVGCQISPPLVPSQYLDVISKGKNSPTTGIDVRYFPKRPLPKIIFQSDKNVQFPKRQHLKSIISAALGLLSSFCSIIIFKKLPFGKLHIWEIVTWEILTWEFVTWKSHLGTFLLRNTYCSFKVTTFHFQIKL